MPLTLARTGEMTSIKHVGGREDTRRFLENLGFVVGSDVMVVAANGGNVIVNVKDTRIALSKSMASRIMV